MSITKKFTKVFEDAVDLFQLLIFSISVFGVLNILKELARMVTSKAGE